MSSNRDQGFISLAQIPTLRELYANGELETEIQNTPSNVRYPAKDAYLDKVSIIKGDITKVASDCIINAADSALLGGNGGGVDGAIHKAAGKKLLEECSKLKGCRTGSAKITGGHLLPALQVIHAVGPIYNASPRQEAADKLASCYQKCFELAVNHSLLSIAFPAISTGAFGYPAQEAAHIALDTTRKFLESEAGNRVDRIIFVLFRESTMEAYQSLMPIYFPFEDHLTTNNNTAVRLPKPKQL